MQSDEPQNLKQSTIGGNFRLPMGKNTEMGIDETGDAVEDRG